MTSAEKGFYSDNTMTTLEPILPRFSAQPAWTKTDPEFGDHIASSERPSRETSVAIVNSVAIYLSTVEGKATRLAAALEAPIRSVFRWRSGERTVSSLYLCRMLELVLAQAKSERENFEATIAFLKTQPEPKQEDVA